MCRVNKAPESILVANCLPRIVIVLLSNVVGLELLTETIEYRVIVDRGSNHISALLCH